MQRAQDMLSRGSLGHPEFCRKPCLYLTYGACPHAENCEYCHHHHERAVKLDKRQRDTLRQLSEPDLLGLMLPHLRARAEKMQPSGADSVLRLMEQHLASLPKQNSAFVPAWKFTQINRLLKQMSFMRLMRLCPCSEYGEISQALLCLQEGYSATSADSAN
ncbi:unnamed protein product [Effrenium voratum]|nr:unnamed protein product [Effrenium voratum]